MADLQGYSNNRVLSNSPDWRHTINYSQTGRDGSSATYSVTIGLQLTEGNFGYGSWVRARVTVNGKTSGWSNFTSSNTWPYNSHKTVTISITAPAGSDGGTLPASVEWNCSQHATSPNFSVSGEFKVSTWNTPPYFGSDAQWLRIRDANSDYTLDGFYSENTSRLKLDWAAASDKEGGTLTYILQQQINGGSWTTIYTGTSREHTYDIGEGNEGEGRLYWVTVKDNNGVQAAQGVYSKTIKKNTLYQGSIASTSGSITNGTSSISIEINTGSNASGAPVRYSIYSDTVQVYNQRDFTGSSETLYIWKEGSTPSGPYVKYDDLKNAFKSSGFKGNMHIGLATKNDYGTKKYSSYTQWVDLRGNATPPSYVNITGGSAKKYINGSYYYLPNGSDTVTFEWSGGGDPLGGSWKYNLYQIYDGNPTFIAEVPSSTQSYSISPPKQNGRHTLGFKVHVVTDYGADTYSSSGTIDLHYYNPPVFTLNSLNRTANTANINFAIKLDTSISSFSISGDWRCSSQTGQSTSGYISNTQNNQSISVSLFNESSHTITFNYSDSSGLSGTLNYTTTIQALNSLMFVNKYGLGVAGNRADENFSFSVNGNSLSKSFINEGIKSTDGTGNNKINWWLNIASLKVRSQYGDAQATFKILDEGSDRQEPISGEIIARIKQQNPMQQSTVAYLSANNLTGLSTSNIKLIEITKSSSLTEYQLWIQIPFDYTFLSTAMTMKIGEVILNPTPSLASNPPGGLQIGCSGAQQFIAYKSSDEGDYYGLRAPNNSSSDWIRVPSSGLLPYREGGASSLGSQYWPFNSIFTKALNGYTINASDGQYRNTVPVVSSDGTLEIGKYIDFHYNTSGTDFDCRLSVQSDGTLKSNKNIETDGDLIAWKYLQIHDWYGGWETGRFYYKQDGKQLITENVEFMQTKKLKFETRIESILSGNADLYAEGRSSNYGWHFANIEGQYSDIYAKVYRQQSDARTKTEIDRPMFLDIDEDRKTILEKINSISPKIYYYNEDKQKTPIFGFFAQDLEKEFPLSINTLKYTDEEIEANDSILPKDKEGNLIKDLKTIDSVSISAILWEGLKEAKKEIEDLKDEIIRLKSKINKVVEK